MPFSSKQLERISIIEWQVMNEFLNSWEGKDILLISHMHYETGGISHGIRITEIGIFLRGA